MLPRPWTNFQIQKCYQNEPKFHGVYSINNLPKINNKANVLNVDKFKLIWNHLIDLYTSGNNGSASSDAAYFESCEVEHIPKETKKLIGNKIPFQIFIEYKHVIG